MPFPELKPSARSWDVGQFPIKTFRAQNGAELRILYGNRMASKTLQLTYQNIADTNADLFAEHYLEVKGSLTQFELNEAARSGWKGARETLGAAYHGLQWRYAEPPQIQSVFNGRSTVTVSLIAVPI